MFIVTPATIWNRSALEMRRVPRRFLGRVMVLPRAGVGWRLFWRMVFEAQVLRYMISLLPFVAAVLIWQESALAISQAPLLMFLLIYAVETRFLRVPKEKRAALIEPAEIERALDLLRVRANRLLTRIAALRGMQEGRLHLVVEQSELARIMPLTLVSVQAAEGPEILGLTAAEQAMIRESLFQPPLDERRLLLVNLALNEFLHDMPLEAKGISGHARLAAMMG